MQVIYKLSIQFKRPIGIKRATNMQSHAKAIRPQGNKKQLLACSASLRETYSSLRNKAHSSVADLVNYEIKSFQKILGNEYYKELSKAIGLFSRGVGVVSFVYLRRIIENFIIKPSLDRAKSQSTWNNDEYEKGRIKEKIDLLKDFLPDFLVTNKETYSILSKGIHNLTEEECMDIFQVLKSSLILILTEVRTEGRK